MNAFYIRSGCFFPSSKILNSDYQTGFNELRVGAFLSCDLLNTQGIPLSCWVAITVLLGCIPMLILEGLKGKVWLIFFKSMSPSPWLILDGCLCTNKQINRGSKMSTMTQPLRILEAVKWLRAKNNNKKKHFCRLVSWAENPVKNISFNLKECHLEKFFYLLTSLYPCRLNIIILILSTHIHGAPMFKVVPITTERKQMPPSRYNESHKSNIFK